MSYLIIGGTNVAVGQMSGGTNVGGTYVCGTFVCGTKVAPPLESGKILLILYRHSIISKSLFTKCRRFSSKYLLLMEPDTNTDSIGRLA